VILNRLKFGIKVKIKRNTAQVQGEKSVKKTRTKTFSREFVLVTGRTSVRLLQFPYGMSIWHFDHSYTALPADFYSAVQPTPVVQPRLLVFNTPLAQALGLPAEGVPEAVWADFLSGNVVPEGAFPIAQAYSGHQFGHFTMLGDGRAILLGEQLTPTGDRKDIQLKGAGPTPYSRRGDGRATLYAMLREYLISEAIHGLGIRTTRSLAVVVTGEPVYRGPVFPGAVLTRVADSHLRVGTFEYARQFLSKEALLALTHYAIERHYPDLKGHPQPAAALLRRVMERQVALIVDWMRVGFIHGVMNTDNMSIAGETIDYGPCAFMNAYKGGTVFSSIDVQGRYAYNNQPAIAQWNIAVLASALLPVLDDTQELAAALAKAVIEDFKTLYYEQWYTMMAAKLGLPECTDADAARIHALLRWMEEHGADYTNTFLRLENVGVANDPLYQDPAFLEWERAWQERAGELPGGMAAAQERMRQTNPRYIPRNHLVEAALEAAAERNDLSLFQSLLAVFQQPYQEHSDGALYQMPPADGDAGYQTFCGT
jgi:uncharacterized protein YdiU (UPF0061 family)